MLPVVSTRRPRPQLRLFAEAVGPSQVGVQQLANVRWSVLFDDLELDAAGIAALAKEAKPLVQVRGRWVHIDRADLAAAASALAERAAITQLSGAAVIRHAVGLEGTSWPGRFEWMAAAGPRICSGAPPRIHRRRSTRPTGSPASCAATRPRRLAGWAFLIGPAWAAAWPWTWAWARRRRCWPTCWLTGATGRRW